jgi:hypothetical protein
LGCSGSVCMTACSSSCQYPATLHSHWRIVGQHSTGHNQKPDQLYMKEMCHTAWGKWWSYQILTVFLIHKYLWPKDGYVYSQSCEIHRWGPDEFIPIDWFPYVNCNSLKLLKLLHVGFIFVFSVYYFIPIQLLREEICWTIPRKVYLARWGIERYSGCQ